MKKFTLPILILAMFLFACNKDTNDSMPPDQTNSELGLGWNADEDASDIPNAISIEFGNSNLPSKMSLIEYVPPIGDQGTKGTCVAFALGYNLKTMISAIENELAQADLNDPAKQTSPADLFLAIPQNQKGFNCEGTLLKHALNVLQNRGAATMATAPYNDQTIGDCSQSTDPTADAEAANHKIEYFRQININVNEIKSHIADKRPVGFGAFLSDNFMTWNSDDVLSSHTTYNNVGQHAGHAMTIIGYDDNKGPNGAFQVVNSWGEVWGDNGYVWIDYDFFTGGDFAIVAYIAENSESQFDPNNVDSNTTTTGVDVAPYMVGDYGMGSDRELEYDVYNIGAQTLTASNDWTTAYVLVNAYDINDYEVILWDYYSDDVGNPGEYGNLSDGYGQHNFYNHVDIPAGSSSAQELIGSFSWSLEYTIPNITGYYYPALIADVSEVVEETNEQNNVFIFSDEYGAPIYFQNGVPDGVMKQKKPQTESDHVSIDAVEKEIKGSKAPHDKGVAHKNAYRKSELKQLLYTKWKNGSLMASEINNSVKKH